MEAIYPKFFGMKHEPHIFHFGLMTVGSVDKQAWQVLKLNYMALIMFDLKETCSV